MGNPQFDDVIKQVNKLYSDLTKKIIKSNLHKNTNQKPPVWNKAMKNIGSKHFIEKFMKLNKAKLGSFKLKGVKTDGIITVTFGSSYGPKLATKHMMRGFNEMKSFLKAGFSDLGLKWPKKM